jgi:hypoxanthine phosphoribosyltransferase
VLLDKASRRQVDIEAEYVGFEIPDRFVVGYGLDSAEQFRELPYVGYVATDA